MCITNKHNYKTFTKNPSASSLHCNENILNHSCGKFRGSLTKGALCTTFIHQYLLNNSIIIKSKK